MEKPFLQQLTEAVEANIGNPSFGAGELARDLGMSYSSLRRKYFSLTGKPVAHFIREIRLNQARQLLQDESLTASEVAFRTGFHSAAYFNTCFHKFFGYPPGERRQNVEGVEDMMGVTGVTIEHPVGTHNCVRDVIIKHPAGTHKFVRVRRIWLGGVAMVLVVAGVLIVLNASGWFRKEKSIAVLPFQNLNPDPTSATFCEDFWNQLTMSLQKIKAFEVRSGISSSQYPDTAKSIQEIGRELNAEFIIEGSIDKEGDYVIVWVQLIEAKTDKHFWAETDTIRADELFDLSDLTVHIADKLLTRLMPREILYINQKCMKSWEAWNNLMAGLHWMNSWPERAEPYFRKAVELDSLWPDALGFLGATLIKMMIDTPYAEYLEESRKLFEKAHALRPGPDTYGNLASYYLRTRDYKKARQFLKKGIREWPDYFNLKLMYALACRTAFGQWQQAEKRMLELVEKHPQNPGLKQNMGILYDQMRDFPKAMENHNQFLMHQPGNPLSIMGLSDITLKEKGDTRQAREIVENANKNNPWEDWNAIQALYQYVIIDIYEGKYQEALEVLSRWFRVYPPVPPPYHFRPKYLFYAMIYGYLDQPELEHVYYDSTRIYIEELFEKFTPLKKNPKFVSCLGMAWAGLGNTDRAHEVADQVIALISDKMKGSSESCAMEDVAWIYTKTGNYKEALKILRKLLSEPGPLTARLLELDPKWEPLKELPEYKKLIKKYSIP